MLSFIEGHTVAEINQVGEEVYEESIAPRIWPGTRAIAQMHLDAGQQVWLVTAAPVEMAGIIAARLGMTGALGNQADTRTASTPAGWWASCCTARPRPRPSAAWPHEHGFDLARCFAYSDSLQRPADALPGRPSRARSTRTAGCCATPRSRTGRSGTTAPAAGGGVGAAERRRRRRRRRSGGCGHGHPAPPQELSDSAVRPSGHRGRTTRRPPRRQQVDRRTRRSPAEPGPPPPAPGSSRPTRDHRDASRASPPAPT